MSLPRRQGLLAAAAALAAGVTACGVSDEPQSYWGIDPGECLHWPELLEEPGDSPDPTDELAADFVSPDGVPTPTPCTEAHHLELAGVVELPEGDFPGAYPVSDTAEELCTDVFDDYLDGPLPAALWTTWWLPTTEEAWEASRVVDCTVEGAHRGSVGSVKGTT